MDNLRGVQILHFRKVDKPVKGPGHPTAERAAVVRIGGVADDLEATAIMVLENPDG